MTKKAPLFFHLFIKYRVNKAREKYIKTVKNMKKGNKKVVKYVDKVINKM